jgi:hypothetical protein
MAEADEGGGVEGAQSIRCWICMVQVRGQEDARLLLAEQTGVGAVMMR